MPALVSFSFSKTLVPFHIFHDTQWPFKNKIKSEYGFKYWNFRARTWLHLINTAQLLKVFSNLYANG
jgi:hypothetical protein